MNNEENYPNSGMINNNNLLENKLFDDNNDFIEKKKQRINRISIL